jgi:hypothetical protein
MPLYTDSDVHKCTYLRAREYIVADICTCTLLYVRTCLCMDLKPDKECICSVSEYISRKTTVSEIEQETEG